MDDQARRGQLIKLSEAEAKARFPNLVVASLGANRKDKPGGALTARVLFDGAHGLKLNTRTRIRDQERAPISSDLKRAMREKAHQGISTFALTADVSEAHRPTGLASSRVPGHTRSRGVRQYCGHFWRRLCFLLLGSSGLRDRSPRSVHCWRYCADLAYASRGRLPSRSRWSVVPLRPPLVFRSLFSGRRPTFLAQDLGWSGLASVSCTGLTNWASQNAGQIGSRSGHEKLLTRLLFIWPGSRKC